MQQKPETGLAAGLRYGYPATGRVQAGDVLRRKLIRKMLARREQRTAHNAGWVRRAP